MPDTQTSRTLKSARQNNAFAPIGNLAREAALQVDAAGRSAANTLTFGGANYLDAAKEALDYGGIDGWKQRYDAILAYNKATDRYNEIHRPIAQTVGAVGGTALGILATGPMEGALAAAPRLAGAARLTGREIATLLAAGGASGAINQGVSDLAGGHGLSSGGDYLGSALGSAAGAGTMLFAGPARAGAVDGAVTSAAQDLFNGRPVAWDQAGHAALAGNLLGGAAGIAGRRWSNGLSAQAKGKLGEALGSARSWADWKPRGEGPPRDPVVVNGRSTYWAPDGWNGDVRLEDKFGPSARLSPNQRAARAALGPNFRLNSFVPADVGKVFSMPLLSTAPILMNGEAPPGGPVAPTGPQPPR